LGSQKLLPTFKSWKYYFFEFPKEPLSIAMFFDILVGKKLTTMYIVYVCSGQYED